MCGMLCRDVVRVDEDDIDADLRAALSIKTSSQSTQFALDAGNLDLGLGDIVEREYVQCAQKLRTGYKAFADPLVRGPVVTRVQDEICGRAPRPLSRIVDVEEEVSALESQLYGLSDEVKAILEILV